MIKQYSCEGRRHMIDTSNVAQSLYFSSNFLGAKRNLRDSLTYCEIVPLAKQSIANLSIIEGCKWFRIFPCTFLLLAPMLLDIRAARFAKNWYKLNWDKHTQSTVVKGDSFLAYVPSTILKHSHSSQFPWDVFFTEFFVNKFQYLLLSILWLRDSTTFT